MVDWEDVRLTYPGGVAALDGVSLRVEKGSCLALLGTSGSGKTTLLKTVNRMERPQSGRVIVRGRDVDAWDPIELRRSMGYVIQEGGLMPHLDLVANVALPLRVSGVPRTEREGRAGLLLEMVGLGGPELAKRRPRELSGGQRQRAGVARALARDPDLLLMDEPFGALDPVTRRRLQADFNALRRKLETTVILVTHDIAEAATLGDTIAVMSHGRLVQVGSISDLRDRPASGFVRELVTGEVSS